MTLKITLSAERIALLFALLALFFAVQSMLGRELEIAAGTVMPHPISQVARIMNIGRESSIPTWYSSAIILLTAALLAIIASGKRLRREADFRYWAGLAMIFLYLSADEAGEIHEKLTIPLQNALAVTGPLFFAWVIVFVPLTVLFVLAYARFLLRLPSRVRLLFVLGGFVYVGAAAGIESINANIWYLGGGAGFTYNALTAVEEFFEMVGIVIFMYGVLSYLSLYSERIEFAFRQAPPGSGQPY